jgi:hypothetical protein
MLRFDERGKGMHSPSCKNVKQVVCEHIELTSKGEDGKANDLLKTILWAGNRYGNNNYITHPPNSKVILQYLALPLIVLAPESEAVSRARSAKSNLFGSRAEFGCSLGFLQTLLNFMVFLLREICHPKCVGPACNILLFIATLYE